MFLATISYYILLIWLKTHLKTITWKKSYNQLFSVENSHRFSQPQPTLYRLYVYDTLYVPHCPQILGNGKCTDVTDDLTYWTEHTQMTQRKATQSWNCKRLGKGNTATATSNSRLSITIPSDVNYLIFVTWLVTI